MVKELQATEVSKSFVVRLHNKEDVKAVRKQKSLDVFRHCYELDAQELPKGLDVRPYRVKVELDEEKMRADSVRVKAFIDGALFIRYSRFLKEVSSQLEQKVKETESGKVEKPKDTLYEAVDAMFKENKGVLKWLFKDGQEHQLTQEEYQEYRYVKSANTALLMLLKNIEDLDTRTHLPVNPYTREYMVFPNGTAYVELIVGASAKGVKSIVQSVVRKMITCIYGMGCEVGDLVVRKRNICVSVVVPNKQVKELFEQVAGMVKKYEDDMYQVNQYIHMHAIYSLGQEEQEKEKMYVLSGAYYESLKEKFTLEDEAYLGLPSYK